MNISYNPKPEIKTFEELKPGDVYALVCQDIHTPDNRCYFVKMVDGGCFDLVNYQAIPPHGKSKRHREEAPAAEDKVIVPNCKLVIS